MGRMAIESDFLGQGFAFPMRVSPSGGIAWSTGADGIGDSLLCVLGTAPGERVMRPSFGCAIWDLLFAPINANTIGLMEEAVREAVGRWEPRIDLESVTVTPSSEMDGRVDILLIYKVRTTNDRRNLVYPFYVIPQE